MSANTETNGPIAISDPPRASGEPERGPKTPARAADRMAAVLAEAGVEVVFVLPGGPIAPLNDALMDVARICPITVMHENSAMFAATGYARASGKLGVVIVTSGPGVLNGMAGLASAYCDGVPLLVLAGEVPRPLHGKGALQDGEHLGIRNILGAVTKWTAEVPDAGAVIPMLAHAMHVAMTGPCGPVALTLPMDVLLDPAPETTCLTASAPQSGVTQRDIQRVAAAIDCSERGVIFAGSGVRAGDGPQQLAMLAEYLQWPVMTTPKGKGVFPENHPLSLGIFGMGGHPSTTQYLAQGVDTILAIGTGLGDVATDGRSRLLSPRRGLIQVDIDASRIGKQYAADLAVIAPADVFMSELGKVLKPRLVPHDLPGFGVERHEDPRLFGNGPEGRISPAQAIREIRELMPEDTIFCIDSGEHFLFATHYLHIDRPDSYIVMTGLGSMGASISALGVKLARPERPVAIICGDGGFAMMGADISTAAGCGLEIAVFVFNDQRLGMVEKGHRYLYGRTPSYSLQSLDIAGMAGATGARVVAVERAGELRALTRDTLLCGGPLVVDVRIDRQVQMPVNQRFESLGAVAKRSAHREVGQ